LRLSLVSLVLGVLFPCMIAIILYVVWEQRREARAQAQENALRVARLAAMQQERLITGAEYFLMALAELPEVRERKAEPCSQIFATLLKKFPYYTNIAAVTPEGEIFCAALPRAKNTNISDRPYFQEALRERRLGISSLLVGRMSGKPNISIAYPAFDSNGPVRAVVFVGLDLTWLNSVAAGAQMPPHSVMTAIDERGIVFSRYPDPEKWIGKATDTPLFQIMLKQKEGVTEAVGRDGVARLYGFTPLYRFKDDRMLFVSVGIPKDVALAPSRRTLLWSLIVIALATALAVTGTWIGADLFIKRRLEGLMDAARTLGDRTRLVFAEPALGERERELELAHAARPVDQERVRSLRLERPPQRRHEPWQGTRVGGACIGRSNGMHAHAGRASSFASAASICRCTSRLSRALSMRTIRSGASCIRAR